MANAVYNFTWRGNSDILRLSRSSDHTLESVLLELNWVEFPARNGVSVARPLPSRAGRLAEVIPVEDSPFFIACVFKRAPGDFVPIGDHEIWNEQLFYHFNFDFQELAEPFESAGF